MTGITCFRNIGQLVQADATTQPGIRLRQNCALLGILAAARRRQG